MKRWTSAIVVFALLIAACGSDSDDAAAGQDCTVTLGAAISETGNFAREGPRIGETEEAGGLPGRCF